ncbi:alpha/beta hydrolase [Corynebacterium incognita]|uniref:Alpha/beta hydrolase n=1 Tax=Corynebacterium incognita TaxID=2754725 RepID=A0A7G7CMF4_9CORY|nr:alpha/beta hydrolase [Corynebacterium incognita]QNE88770.1 alpha/beta hydrolase [Corynebacterium incognita]
MPAQPPVSPNVVELDGPFEHEMLHARGIRLHAAVAGSPEDPLIVLLHDAYGGWHDFRDCIAPLAQAGFHVAALDLRGFGMSDKPPGESGQDIRTFIGDVVGAIRALGHDDAVLVGADSGAALAWGVALQHPAMTRGLMSVSGAFPVDMRRAIAARPWDFGWIILRALWFRMPSRLVRLKPGFNEGAIHRHLLLNTASRYHGTEHCARTLRLRADAALIPHAARGIMWHNRLLTAVVPVQWFNLKVQCPTLFIHADQGLWRPVVRRAAARVEAPFSSRHIRGTKNLPHVEAPGDFVDTLLGWLRQH